MRRIRALLAREHGYSLVELLTVVTILGTVTGALTSVFVSASNGELGMNQRFQAQENARLAIDKLRAEIHCAKAVTPVGLSSSITLSISTACPTAAGLTPSLVDGLARVRWCVQPSTALSGRYALYRSTADTCTTATGVKWADYLTTQPIFTYSAQYGPLDRSSGSLASLAVALAVNVKLNSTRGTFRLNDDIVLRNSSRTCVADSPRPPCP